MDNHATHRQLVKLAHQVLAAQPTDPSDFETVHRLKDACGRYGFTWRFSHELSAALTSAAWQRSPHARGPR